MLRIPVHQGNIQKCLAISIQSRWVKGVHRGCITVDQKSSEDLWRILRTLAGAKNYQVRHLLGSILLPWAIRGDWGRVAAALAFRTFIWEHKEAQGTRVWHCYSKDSDLTHKHLLWDSHRHVKKKILMLWEQITLWSSMRFLGFLQGQSHFSNKTDKV